MQGHDFRNGLEVPGELGGWAAHADELAQAGGHGVDFVAAEGVVVDAVAHFAGEAEEGGG